MILKKLTFKNFMSYASAEIDFSGISTACLIGPNGAGKSTLLDAITWALWEEGRSRTDELIKLGKDEMSSELDFFLEEELYRVYRSRTKAFKNTQGKSNLEFQIFNPDKKEWISLSMSQVKLTQDLITKTIKMDYQTFVNSVYLRQGKADEFTIKRPGERKQILANILGLEVYDKLSDVSKDKIKEIEKVVAWEQNHLEELENKIQKEDEIGSRLKDAQNDLIIREKELACVRELLTLKEKELSKKKEKQEQIYALEKTRESQAMLIKTMEDQLEGMKLKEARYKDLISDRLKIQKDYKEYLELKDKIDKHEKQRVLHTKLAQEKNILELQLREEIRKLEQELAVYKSRLNDKETAKLELLDKLKDEPKFNTELKPKVLSNIKEFYALQEEIKEIESKGNELKTELAHLELEKKNVTSKIHEINEKVEVLKKHKHSELCPLCKSLITNKERVIDTYKEDLCLLKEEEDTLVDKLRGKELEIEDKRKKYVFIKNKMTEIKAEVVNIAKELSVIRKEKVELRQLDKYDETRAISFLESSLEFADNFFKKTKEEVGLLDKEILEVESRCGSLNEMVTGGDTIKRIGSSLAMITKEINNLGYSEKDNEELKRLIKEKEDIPILYNNLEAAEREFAQVGKEIKILGERLVVSKKSVEDLSFLIKQNELEIENVPVLERELSDARKEESQKNNMVQEAKKRVILFEQAIAEIKTCKQLFVEKESKVKDLLVDKKYYEILEKAFSKNGIQVAVIEAVVPEIEKEANRILSRLTEGQMHIALKTQRERKSTTGLLETLDVVISDGQGTRKYELYSGGETFKVNFALRLALSRLLANRSGARLQTLIIDEGFGSQDLSGREKLLEVIKSVQNEFELILVITHIDELKESFPVQIHISKEDDGSKIKLIA